MFEQRAKDLDSGHKSISKIGRKARQRKVQQQAGFKQKGRLYTVAHTDNTRCGSIVELTSLEEKVSNGMFNTVLCVRLWLGDTDSDNFGSFGRNTRSSEDYKTLCEHIESEKEHK